MKKEIKELEALGANVTGVKGGLRLNGDWNYKCKPYHHLFVKIMGWLHTHRVIQSKDFLPNLTYLGGLNTSDVVQDKDFLSSLVSLVELDTSNAVQHKDFLSGLTSLGILNICYVAQDKDFLSSLTSLGFLDTSYSIQHRDFLSNLTLLGTLDTPMAVQHKDFLRNLNSQNLAHNNNFFVGNKERTSSIVRNFLLMLFYIGGTVSWIYLYASGKVTGWWPIPVSAITGVAASILTFKFIKIVRSLYKNGRKSFL